MFGSCPVAGLWLLGCTPTHTPHAHTCGSSGVLAGIGGGTVSSVTYFGTHSGINGCPVGGGWTAVAGKTSNMVVMQKVTNVYAAAIVMMHMH